MSRKILAYNIGSNVVGVDILTWNTIDLNNNEPFKIILSTDVIPSGYTDISSITYWDDIGMEISNDYLVVKNEVKELVTLIGWSGLTNTEKDIAISYYAYENAEDAVMYLIMNGICLNENKAIEYLTEKWHIHHGLVIESLKIRWYYVKLVTSKYLSFKDSLDIFDVTVTNLITNMFNTSLLGYNYGDAKDGIMDFIESTNGFYGNGLRERNYKLNTGTWDDFIKEIKDVLIYGIYTKY